MLEPAIVDFAERNPISSSDTRQATPTVSTSSTQTAQQQTPKADYRAISETNNVLSVNNVNPEYANTVASAVQQVEPVVFQQQMAMQQKLGGPQLTLTMGENMMSGFVNVLVLSMIFGLVIGLFIILGIWLFK